MAEFENFGFYTVDVDYLQFLNSRDSEVYYNPSYRTAVKPFVGIVVDLGGFKYFIPLTSAKEKHVKWKNSCNEHFLVYEVMDRSIEIEGDIYKPYSNDKKMHILSVLDLKKMIPVPPDSYDRIIFDQLEDKRYQDLFEKEYRFCLTIKQKILDRAEKIYTHQKETQLVRRTYCNFSCCENSLTEWLRDKKTRE